MSNSIIILNAHRSGYSVQQIQETMTVGELIAYLESNFEYDTPIYLSHDRGYTYGGITEGDFEMSDLEGEEEKE